MARTARRARRSPAPASCARTRPESGRRPPSTRGRDGRGAADFRGIADVEPRLHVSEVVQKVVIRTDEAGTEGAAATGVVMQILSLPRQISMNRPFLFFVRDRPTGTILFMGRVADPSQASTK